MFEAAGLTLTSTWCLLGTFRVFGLLKSKKESQSFNLRGLIIIGRLPTAKKLKKRVLFTILLLLLLLLLLLFIPGENPMGLCEKLFICLYRETL